jgi:hypothetical protein
MNIFEQHPNLRKMIGDHGTEVTKCRPVNSRMAGLFEDGTVEAYLIIDCDWWRRELIPITVRTSTINKVLLFPSIDNKVQITFDSLKLDFDYWMIGLAFFAPVTNAWTVNPFAEWPEVVTPNDNLIVNYTLSFDPAMESYMPYEDYEFLDSFNLDDVQPVLA